MRNCRSLKDRFEALARVGARLAVATALAAPLLGPAPAAAQRWITVRVTPRAGLLTPADWFYEEFKHFGVSPLEWTQAAVLRAPVVGLTAEVEPAGTGLWLRGEVLRTLDAETSVTYAVLIPASTAGPARVVRTYYRVPSAVTIGSFDVGLPTRFSLPLGVQPYVTAGIGGKRYHFDNTQIAPYQDQIVIPRSGTVLTGNIGAGVTFSVLGVDFDLLARDAISDYWGKQQHDVMVLGGLTWTVF